MGNNRNRAKTDEVCIGGVELEKPILFNQEMVKAILEGRKTVTRRVVKKKYSNTDIEIFTDNINTRVFEVQNDVPEPVIHEDGSKTMSVRMSEEIKQPYKVGDILYVRETWLKADDGYKYRANETPTSKEVRIAYGYKWKPSIHMPKEAARIFLKVTDVRVERLQDINCPEAKKEGVLADESIREDGRFLTEKGNFIELWDSTIKKSQLDKYGWESNPLVWVIEFERFKR